MHDSTLQPILAVLGYPVAGNPMQFVVERLLADADLDWQILSLNVAPEQLSDALVGADAMGLAGLAIADPHRAEAAAWFNQPAVVDFVVRDVTGRLRGENLLGEQLVELLAVHLQDDEEVVVYGSDDDALAAAISLTEHGRVVWLPELPHERLLENRPNLKLESPPDGRRGVVTDTARHLPPASDLLGDLRASDFPPAVPVTRLDLTVAYIGAAIHRWTERAYDADIIRDLVEEYWAI